MPDLTGQIGLVPHPHTAFEYIIDWVTKSTVHHAVLAISETECVSCEGGGARLRPISYYPDAYWSDFPLTGPERDAIVKYGEDHIGTPYNWWDDIAIGVGLLMQTKTPLWLQRYLSSDYTLECAQLCDAAFSSAGIHFFDDTLPGGVYPGMFVPIFRSYGRMP